MDKFNNKLLISVADLSAEKYAYFIINELIEKNTDIEVLAVGGNKLKQLANNINKRESCSRVKFLADSIKYSSVGFFENLNYVPFS